MEPPAKVVRFAPFWAGRVRASFWRIFAQGKEVYVANRGILNTAKASFHSSGRCSFNAGVMRKDFAPMQRITGSSWKIAVHLQFFVDEDSRPLHEAEELKSAFTVLSTPPGSKLAVVLLFGSRSTTFETPLPTQFPGQIIMRTKLRNGPPIVVVAGVMPQTAQDRDYVDSARRRSGKFASPPDIFNVEYCEVKSDPNLISIIPLREADFLEAAVPVQNGPPASGRTVQVTQGVSATPTSRNSAGPSESLLLMLVGRD
jgi:hypothetical protein